MKRIGYIYKYNEQEKKGLLFYSCSWQKPIKFFIDDCISNVKTNQLVYFDFVDSKSVKNIECASLSNFRKEIIKEIVSYYDDSQDWQLGDKKSCICFENLLDIISYDKHGEMRNVDIPESIDELYNFFGAFEHLDYDLDEGFDDESSIYVNILDISYWINQNNLEQKYYGKTAGEILNLFDWFVRKKKSAHEKFGKNNHVYDISISPTWGLLLSFLSEKELRELYINEILFQPVLPEVFCLNNLEMLSINYGFTSKTVCEAYYRYRINKIGTTIEYIDFAKRISDAMDCPKNKQEENGVLLNHLDEEVLCCLLSHLKKQYEKVVISNLKITLSQISNNRINGESKINELISQKEEDYVVKLGLFVDKYSLIDKYVIDDIADATKLLCSYNDLMIDDKKELKFLMEIISRKCVLLIAAECRKSNEASFLYHVMEEFALWIDLTTKLKIRELVNVKFSLLNNVEELSYAYEGGFISEEQYLVRYITLTKDFTIEQFLEAIRKDFYKDIPILIQEYIIREVIRKFDFTELSSDAYVKLNYNVIHNMEELIQWFNEQSDIYLDKSLWNTIKEEMVSRLNKENRWYLFEKDLIESPSKEIIREKLEQAYLMYKFSGDYINKDCFQKIMQEDVLREKKDYKKISLILDSLNDIYKDDILENGDDFHRFYVWVEKPKEITDRRLTQIINWDTISRYYALLPDKLQVRLLKYLFYLKAFHKIDFSINDFYVMLMTNSIGRVNSTLQLICFILLEKSKSLSTIIKGEIKSREADIDILKDLFYECDGLLLKGQFDDFPFIDGSIRKEGDYFVISLHDYLGDASYVKAVLTQNLPCKLINGEYWISTNLELEVKDFVVSYGIKDQCQLFKKQHLSQRANVKYRERNLMLCKCGKCLDVDPEFGLPFYWCRKKVCTHSGRYLVPLFDWEEYKFVDLLNILYGNDLSLREKIWNVNAEISQFLIYGSNSNHEILGYFYKSKKKNSHYIRYESERGVWTEDMSIITDVNLDEEVYDDYDDYDEDDIYYCNKDDEDEDEYNGYGRYAGSYAQDEMGYSDDDIDTIFDGDPDAYWNID